MNYRLEFFVCSSNSVSKKELVIALWSNYLHAHNTHTERKREKEREGCMRLEGVEVSSTHYSLLTTYYWYDWLWRRKRKKRRTRRRNRERESELSTQNKFTIWWCNWLRFVHWYNFTLYFKSLTVHTEQKMHLLVKKQAMEGRERERKRGRERRSEKS